MRDSALEQTYAECLALARRHYENFPVASWLLPRRLRRPIAVIYAFARTADDLADEGDLTATERLAGLQTLGDMLDGIAAGKPPASALGLALADTIATHNLPIPLFHDLLSAFRQDITKTRYADFGEVMAYCRRSANPIGRLLLQLVNETDPRRLAQSDAICSALQLINFYQDLAQDFAENDRIYIPQDELQRFGVTEAHFRERNIDPAMRQLMQLQYRRAERLLRAGAPLAKAVRGRLGWELRLTVLAGSRVLDRLNRDTARIFTRPRLLPIDWVWIFWHAVRGR